MEPANQISPTVRMNADYAARAAKGGLNSYEIFDYAVNGTA